MTSKERVALRLTVLRDSLAPFHTLSERDRVKIIIAQFVPCDWIHDATAPCGKCGAPTPDGYDNRPQYMEQRLEAAGMILGSLT